MDTLLVLSAPNANEDPTMHLGKTITAENRSPLTAPPGGGYFGFYGLDLTAADATEPGQNPLKTPKHRRIFERRQTFCGNRFLSFHLKGRSVQRD